MKQVLETYGGTVMAIIVLSGILLIFGIFFRGNTMTGGNAAGALANISLEKSEYRESKGTAFLHYENRRLPKIVFMNDVEIKTGVYIPVDMCFQAISHEGELLPVKVRDIKNLQEESLSVYMMEGKENFYFEVPGVYHVFVEATDKENRSCYSMVKIPVNKGAAE